jgi:hypothetical protein
MENMIPNKIPIGMVKSDWKFTGLKHRNKNYQKQK